MNIQTWNGKNIHLYDSVYLKRRKPSEVKNINQLKLLCALYLQEIFIFLLIDIQRRIPVFKNMAFFFISTKVLSSCR